GERIDYILDAIEYIVQKYENHTFMLPVHPNPNVKVKIYNRLDKYKNVYLLEPLDYPNLVYLMKNAKLILTDSGGIQEEAPSFGCPTYVLRYETERQEGIDAGVSVLVGADYDKIIKLSCEIVDKSKDSTRLTVQNPYGSGQAAGAIEKIINNYFLNKKAS
ncbi:UDP-N-acetylglucosamine 2-epimerase, partial [bacterium]|nr:UDP-N-acetylglucosamine 2-epimerase [bacterium]